ncbi:hypothetical protein GUJ93_ZPchr0002g23138 [Zizania palustris]|uniref:Uncharacterized protein n=1 Tax=Zizania palustris TaxID=103762 RepID=A0A8J5RMS3_ZIZPA|nr:hypothetical protein GUJ93_ZPchr0002g23138 [Zizania palustris]
MAGPAEMAGLGSVSSGRQLGFPARAECTHDRTGQSTCPWRISILTSTSEHPFFILEQGSGELLHAELLIELSPAIMESKSPLSHAGNCLDFPLCATLPKLTPPARLVKLTPRARRSSHRRRAHAERPKLQNLADAARMPALRLIFLSYMK